MKVSRQFFLLMSLGVIGVLGYACFVLIQWKFNQGDVYPRLSSLRSDPRGARVLYEALDTLSEIEVSRNYQEWEKIREDGRAAMFFLSLDPWDLESLGRNNALVDLVASGGRLVFAMDPRKRPLFFENIEDSEEPENLRRYVVEGAEPELEKLDSSTQRLDRLWQGTELIEISEYEAHQEATFSEESVGTSGTISWRKRFAFEIQDETWRSVLTLNEETVAATREYGKGSIVILADDYFFSNEAMLLRPSASMIDWLIGDMEKVIFDESHFGILESEGIAGLAKKYQLAPLILVFAFMVFLWIWRNAIPLVPNQVSEDSGSMIVAESSSDAGFAELIARTVPSKEHPLKAYELWKASLAEHSAERARYAAQIAEADQAVDMYKGKSKTDPRAFYFKLKSIINSKHKAQA